MQSSEKSRKTGINVNIFFYKMFFKLWMIHSCKRVARIFDILSFCQWLVMKQSIELYHAFHCLSSFPYFLMCIWFCCQQPEYKAADPICTFLFSVLVVATTLPVTKDVFRILMEGEQKWENLVLFSLMMVEFIMGRPLSSTTGTPQHVDVVAVKKQLLSVRGVADLHNLHTWSLNTNNCLISVHVAAGKYFWRYYPN